MHIVPTILATVLVAQNSCYSPISHALSNKYITSIVLKRQIGRAPRLTNISKWSIDPEPPGSAQRRVFLILILMITLTIKGEKNETDFYSLNE